MDRDRPDPQGRSEKGLRRGWGLFRGCDWATCDDFVLHMSTDGIEELRGGIHPFLVLLWAEDWKDQG